MSFEDWWYEQEGFGLRAERFFEEECERDMQLFINMKKWLEAAYEAGQEKDADEWYEKTLWGDKRRKCIVKDCENHADQGAFTGDLCNPCHAFITEGSGFHSQAYRNAKREWVGLTDDEIGEIKQTSPIYVSAKAVNAIAPMVEAKLKEKNT